MNECVFQSYWAETYKNKHTFTHSLVVVRIHKTKFSVYEYKVIHAVATNNIKWEKEYTNCVRKSLGVWSQNSFLISFRRSVNCVSSTKSVVVFWLSYKNLFHFFEFLCFFEFLFLPFLNKPENCKIKKIPIRMKCIRQIVVWNILNRVLLNEQFAILDLEFIIAIDANKTHFRSDLKNKTVYISILYIILYSLSL